MHSTMSSTDDAVPHELDTIAADIPTDCRTQNPHISASTSPVNLSFLPTSPRTVPSRLDTPLSLRTPPPLSALYYTVTVPPSSIPPNPIILQCPLELPLPMRMPRMDTPTYLHGPAYPFALPPPPSLHVLPPLLPCRALGRPGQTETLKPPSSSTEHSLRPSNPLSQSPSRPDNLSPSESSFGKMSLSRILSFGKAGPQPLDRTILSTNPSVERIKSPRLSPGDGLPTSASRTPLTTIPTQDRKRYKRISLPAGYKRLPLANKPPNFEIVDFTCGGIAGVTLADAMRGRLDELDNKFTVVELRNRVSICVRVRNPSTSLRM